MHSLISSAKFHRMKVAAQPSPARNPGGEDPSFSTAVAEGLADAKSGRVTPYEKVRRWLLSWGGEEDRPLA